MRIPATSHLPMEPGVGRVGIDKLKGPIDIFTRKSSSANRTQRSNANIELMRAESRFGPKVNLNHLTVLDRLRIFATRYPKTDKLLTGVAVLGTAAALGAFCDLAIDELAHLTDRKNDHVGLLFGTVVGVIFALGHSMQLAQVFKRTEMHFRWGDFRQDASSPAGVCRQLIEQRCLPLLMAMYRNAKSFCGIQHEHLIVQESDIKDALDYIAKYGIQKSEWKNYLVVHDTAPLAVGTYFRATTSVPDVGIEAGKYYQSRYASANHMLQRDWEEDFCRTPKRLKALISLKFDDFNSPQALKAAMERHPDLEKAAQHSSCISNKETLQMLGMLAVSRQKKLHNQKSGTFFDEENFLKPRIDHSDESLIRLNADLTNFFAKIYAKDSALNSRTWDRVDEFTKVKPVLEGLRPASLHTFFLNLGGAFVTGGAAGTDSATQARNAGTSFGLYIPMVTLGSVVTVLGLGMSSTAGPVGSTQPATSNEVAKKQNTAMVPNIQPIAVTGNT